jgi:prevent-host-death family protein
MSASVNVHEAKTHFSKLMERVHAGEEIIVAKAGKPYMRMVPLEAEVAPKRKRTPGGWEALKEIPDSVWFEPMSDEELDIYEGKYDDLV